MQKEERRRAVLTPRNRLIEAVLGGRFDEATLNDTTRWGNRLQAEALRWMLRGGFGDRGRITKGDAARMFANAFGAGEREQ